MASLNDLFKNGSAQGIAIGIGAAILAPVLLPVLASVAKPMARAAIKAGILAFEKGKETVAELGEVFEDLVAEAKAELEHGAHAAPPAVGAAEMAATTTNSSETAAVNAAEIAATATNGSETAPG